jgi:dihydrofolate reductase
MILSLIVAVAENNAIGRDNNLPWHLPEDLKFFKKHTLGKPVIMGRKTYQSLGRPLPGRLNIVLSGNSAFPLPDGVLLYNNMEDAIQKLELDGTEEAFVIGGSKVFGQAMQIADIMYITRVHTVIADADVFLPHIDHSQWHLAWEEAHKADDKHAYDFTFRKYERIEL